MRSASAMVSERLTLEASEKEYTMKLLKDTDTPKGAPDDDAGEREWQAIWEPLFSLLTPAQRTQARAILAQEASGILNWALKSGYLLWVRTHPDQRPTWAQFRAWARSGAPPLLDD
jgi:hypothetical protein